MPMFVIAKVKHSQSILAIVGTSLIDGTLKVRLLKLTLISARPTF